MVTINKSINFLLSNVCVCVRVRVRAPAPYLVVHPQADDLGQEGAREASADQLLVGPAQRRLVQALPHHAPRKLVHLQAQVGRPVGVWVHLRRRRRHVSFPPHP